MTQNEFFRALRSLRRNGFEISICAQSIRLNKSDLPFCPITAIYYNKNGVFIHVVNYDLCARNLKMDQAFAKKVADSSDKNGRYLNKECKVIRRKIKEALQLC
jgi:hypothetical protein